MPEAVIVATARSPIGRAFKGSLVDARPDDLAAQMVEAVLAKVPQLPVEEIEDLMLGCGLPGGGNGESDTAPGPCTARRSRAVSSSPQCEQVKRSPVSRPQPSWRSSTGGPSSSASQRSPQRIRAASTG